MPLWNPLKSLKNVSLWNSAKKGSKAREQGKTYQDIQPFLVSSNHSFFNNYTNYIFLQISPKRVRTVYLQ